MNWTSEPPTEPGRYWWRPNTKVGGNIVSVYEMKSVGIYVLATIDGWTWALTVDRLSGEWTERIPEPDEDRQ